MDQLEACSVKVGSPTLTCERGVRLGLSKPVLRLAGVVAEVGGAQAADVEGEAPPAALLVEQLTVSLVQLLVAPEPRYLQGSGMSSSGITCISTSIFRQGHTYTNGLSGKFELHCNFLTPSPPCYIHRVGGWCHQKADKWNKIS